MTARLARIGLAGLGIVAALVGALAGRHLAHASEGYYVTRQGATDFSGLFPQTHRYGATVALVLVGLATLVLAARLRRARAAS